MCTVLKNEQIAADDNKHQNNLTNTIYSPKEENISVSSNGGSESERKE